MNSLLAFAAVFLTLVLFHELGHFLAAKAVGVAVQEFAVGFGPALARVRWRGTVYSLRLFPLGGFVRLAGMEGPQEGEEPAAEPARMFHRRPLWQRVVTIAAGPAMNFLLAAGLMAVLYVPPSVAHVEKGSPAERAGIQPGDRVVRVGHLSTPTAARVLRAVHGVAPGTPLRVEVLRDGRRLAHTVVTARHPVTGVSFIGVRWRTGAPPLEGLYGGFVEMVDSAGEVLRALVRMLSRREGLTVAGPAGIFSMVAEAAGRGVLPVVGLAAVLSVNLGLINLLPLPVLDGGWLLFLALEWVRRRPLEPRLQTAAQMLGMVILVALMLLATYFDLKRLGQG
ncbi:MAG TPA: M50 family metallopeptidase [Limnochordales bacterium]